MNYFLKKSHSRFLTILVVLSLLVTMLAGCQRKEPEESTEPTDNKPGLELIEPTKETEPEPTETTSPINDNMAVVKDQLNVRSSPSTGAPGTALTR